MGMIQQLIDQITRLFCWIIVVAPWEQGIRVRLGSNVKLLDAGWHLAIPIVDRVYRQSCRRRLAIVSAMTLSTRDGRTITVSGYIGYSIVDLLKLYSTISHAEDTIEAEISSLITDFISSHTFDECKVQEIEAHVKSKMNLERYGVEGSDFFISNFAAVKTYRFITGEVRQWMRTSTQLDTDRMQNPNGTYI